MRITPNFFYDTINRQTQANTKRAFDAQQAIVTGKRISRVSDNTLEAPRLLDVKKTQARNEQFLRNIERTSDLNDIYDQTLAQAEELIVRAKELLLGEASEVTSTEVTREAARVEIASLASQLVQLTNTRFGGQYIFSGFAVETPAFADATVAGAPGGGNTGGAAITDAFVENPAQVRYNTTYEVQFTGPATYDVINVTTGQTVATAASYVSGKPIFFDGLEVTVADSPGAPAPGDLFSFTTSPPGAYQGDNGQQQVEIQTGTFIQQNVRGDRVFQGVGISGGIDVFDAISAIVTALETNDRAAIESGLTALDTSRSQLSSERAGVGSRQNLLQSVQERQQEVKFSLETLRSSIEDTDITEASLALNAAQGAMEATLSAAGRILNISLLDFLR